ncbi:MAG: hypothetical protein JOZ01_06625 [Candidatus Eremiobacteraeota bacterium]|nr:hypothetical protein [Candidatus Eremiobacteraeota bacterium]
MTTRTRLGVLVATIAFAATTLAVSAAESVTLYDGTMLNARLNQQLDSSSAHVGDVFTMTVIPPYPSGNPAFQGATISGQVTKVQRAGQGRNPEIVIVPQYLRLYGGSTVSIYGNVTSIAANKSTGSTAGKAALGALAGMLIGNAIGKTIFHASGGGAVGLIGGALLGANNKSNFTIPPGANATVQLTQTVTVRRQASSPY